MNDEPKQVVVTEEEIAVIAVAEQGPAGASTPDATPTVKGKLQLAGDLAGTADAPTVPGLASKSDVGHSHAISDVTNLQTALNGKAATSHTHAIADTTGLQTALDGKAASSHAHAISDVTNLQDDLDGKAPVTHSHVAKDISDFDSSADARITAQKGEANGIATLGADSKIPSSQLPAIAVTSTSVVASEAAQIALTAQEGDMAIRTDRNRSYIHNGGTSGAIADWTELLTPTDTILSVNGKTGTVVLTTSDVAEGTNLYFTDARTRAALSGTTNQVNYSSSTGVISLPQNIHASATPTFASMTLGASGGTGKLAVGGATTSLATFVNTAASDAGAGAGMIGLSNDGAAMASGDRLGFYLLGGAYNDAAGLHNAAGMSSYATEAWSATNRGADLRFETTTAGAAGRSVKMRLNETGLAIGDFDATHTLSIPASGTGLSLFSTPDRTINTEKLHIRWSGNISYISNNCTGTGSARAIRLGTTAAAGTDLPTNYVEVRQNSSPSIFNIVSGSFAGTALLTTSTTLNGSLVAQDVLNIAYTVNQSGTAGSTGLLLNATASALGSGSHYLIDAQVGGVSKFSVDNAGNIVLAGNLTKTASSPPASAGATGTTGRIEWDANYIYVCTAANTWKRAAIATW